MVKNTVVNALRGHFNLNGPKKALVLSFHGSTGVGKNFVVQFIANSLFARGVRSKFFKLFIASRDFPHNDKIDEYRETIIKTIESTVKQCHTNLFVFDETDKIPIGLIDTIKAYIDFYPEVDGIMFRKSVFIFLSNSAAKDIAHLTLNFDKQVRDRNDFEIKLFQSEIQNSIYHNKEDNEKGLWHASIIDSYLIDFYVPFLPLERDHVRNCIRAEFKNYNISNKANVNYVITDNEIEQIVDEHVYEPPGYKKYSTSGCKRVPFLVRTFISRKQFEINDEF
jgi:torsin-1